MPRDRKRSITQEAARIVFPVSISSSFSLPSLSLSRSKPTPVLPPLDTTRANAHPLDNGGATSSFITPTSHPNALELSASPARSVSPSKPPASPGASVPLPSIRSLRSRFSFTTQEPPNLSAIPLQTPTQKRAPPRRFLPFGNSGSTTQSTNSTPSIPRKSLGDVFTLGRPSTGSRHDSTSSRSVTPSSKSSRSAASMGTMRGQWLHGSGYSMLAPHHQAASPRPLSEDFALDAELGYVLAIESGEDTIRCRPDLPPAEPPPRLRDSNQTILESSRENLSQMTLSPQSKFLRQHFQHLCHLHKLPPPSLAPPIQISGVKAPATILDSEGEDDHLVPTTFPFTPVDDRSDVTSSTNNTPHSGDRSRVPPSIPPPCHPHLHVRNRPRGASSFSEDASPLMSHVQRSSSSEANWSGREVEPSQISNAVPVDTLNYVQAVPECPTEVAFLNAKTREMPNLLAADLGFGSGPLRNPPLGLAAKQSDSDLETNIPDNELLPFNSDSRTAHIDKHAHLLSTLGTLDNSSCSATPSVRGADQLDANTITRGLVFQSVQPATPPVQDPNQGGHWDSLPLPVSTPSPSVLSTRVNDLLSAKSLFNVQRPSPTERNAVSLNGSPMLSPSKLSSSGSWGADQTSYREAVTTPNNPARLLPRRSPSVGAAITRKRSASFDSSGSPKITKDTSDPFASHVIGPKRTDWLGPRTAKAFAAAGLIEKDRDRTGLNVGPRSDTPHRGGALNSWRTYGERYGGFGSSAGSARSHSRLGSEIISPSHRTRSLVGGDSSPSYRRSSLDHTAPPSPVSTHRTLVSSATSSSQSQSALQTMRERHELETEALLLALAGSKRTERDLRAENDELMAYILQLERRIAVLETEKEQAERSQSRARDYRWNTPPPSDVEALDRRRQEILAGRASTRAWSSSNTSTISGGRSPLYGRPPLSAGLPRSASAASVRKSAGPEPDRISPSKPSQPWDMADSRTSPRSQSTLANVSTPTRNTINHSAADISVSARNDFDDWNDSSFSQPLESSPKKERLVAGCRRPGGEFGDDEVSFRSASPLSITLIHPRSNTPKATPANISPITADFSFNSIPGSPRSLRLGPDEEMHLADLISLQGLEITDAITNLDG
ncbi:hypothetical protein RHS01_00051 [Rhizoctonia solani]|uniref:Uncharacterized protein n=1 Tax=Rhizoctonia solani TaxID=456999 RepID=A0A8H7M8T9_9AGAM|nr:hypothetical protein RHS01_00051 [Rhizoctonia solani]